MAGGLLAQYAVEFSAKDAKAPEQAVDAIVAKLKAGETAAGKAGAAIGAAVLKPLSAAASVVGRVTGGLAAAVSTPFRAAGAFVLGFAGTLLGPVTGALQRLGTKLQEVGQRAAVPFALASAAVLGWVRAGLSGTTAGEALGVQMQFLSREIAQLFLPVIQRVISGVQRVTDWFRSLSGEQQNAIGKWITLGVATLGVATILPRLIGGLKGIGAALALLAANPLLALVAGIGAFLLATEEGNSALARLGQTFKPVLQAVGALWEAFKPIVQVLADVLPPLVEALAPAFRVIASVIKTIVEFITSVVEGIKEVLGLAHGLEVAGGLLTGPRRDQQRQGRNELFQRGGGTESVQATFARFQAAAIRTDPGRRLQEEQRDYLRTIAENTGRRGGDQRQNVTPQPPQQSGPPLQVAQ